MTLTTNQATVLNTIANADCRMWSWDAFASIDEDARYQVAEELQDEDYIEFDDDTCIVTGAGMDALRAYNKAEATRSRAAIFASLRKANARRAAARR